MKKKKKTKLGKGLTQPKNFQGRQLIVVNCGCDCLFCSGPRETTVGLFAKAADREAPTLQ